jgi:long-subunit acyl-CoA synthetase (AMP-forming)
MTVESPAAADIIDPLDVASLCAAFQNTAAANGDEVALRTPGGVTTITWRRYVQRVESIARGLVALGVGRGDTVALMMTNRPEFNLVDAAVMHLGATPFSVYNTLTGEQIAHLFSNSGNRVVVADSQYAGRILAAARDTAVQHVVIVEAACAGAISLQELEANGDLSYDFEAGWRAVTPDDVATLIYTSGTTGPPKGVEITHGGVLACLRSMRQVVGAEQGDRLISYLPSAHVADRFFSHYVALAFGAEITCLDDAGTVAALLPEVRPTSWAAVPRIWEKLEAALRAGLAAEPDTQRQQALQWAIETGLRKVRAEQAALRGEGPGPDDLLLAEYAKAEDAVLAELRATIGLDQVRWTMSGAAPIAPETLEFFLAIGVPVCELWGMSEMMGGTLNPPDRVKLGTVGRALPGVELRLADDGELLVRSPFVMRGYRGEPQRTAEALDADGWLSTGDIAEIDDDGYVRIVDRKKDLIINAGGKNMSPTNIENAIKGSCGLIDQAIAIGDRRPYNVALLTLSPDALGGRLVTDPDVVADVRAGIDRANERLARVEQIKRFQILDEDWEPGGPQLTPTSKLKRKPIAQLYAGVIDEIYARP